MHASIIQYHMLQSMHLTCYKTNAQPIPKNYIGTSQVNLAKPKQFVNWNSKGKKRSYNMNRVNMKSPALNKTNALPILALHK